jgi:transcriptional regulator with XRE-family HTH domain
MNRVPGLPEDEGVTVAEAETTGTTGRERRAELLLRSFSEIVQSEGVGIREFSTQAVTRSSFANAVSLLLKGLGWRQVDLAAISGIADSQISAFLKGKTGREIGQDDVCRIAWALAAGLDGLYKGGSGKATPRTSMQVGSRGIGRAKLDLLLNGLLLLAGYSAQTRFQDKIWREKFVNDGDALRIGWFQWEPVVGDHFSGYAQQVTEKVCQLLGKQCELVELVFSEVNAALRNGSVDLVAPILMRFPRRRAWTGFSAGIPGTKIGLNVALQTERLPELVGDKVVSRSSRRRKKHGSDDARLPASQVQWDRVTVHVVEGEVAATVAGLLLPERGEETLPHKLENRHGDYLIDKLLAGELDEEGRIPLVLTNGPDCVMAAQRHGSRMTLLDERVCWEELEDFALPLAFALPPDEPSLSAAINEAIKTLDEMKFFERLAADCWDKEGEKFSSVVPSAYWEEE